MPIAMLASPKGGVGRTTLCANVGVAMQALGYRVVVVDLDPQNALTAHFQLVTTESRGLIGRFELEDWSQLVTEQYQGLQILPFGVPDAVRFQQFAQSQLKEGWLATRLRSLLATPNTLVLVDLPAPLWLTASPLTDAAEIVLVTLLADPGSLALLPRLETQRDTLSTGDLERIGFIINQVDTRSRLKREIVELMISRLSPRVLGTIHRDEAVAEAMAEQRSLTEQAPFSAAARDVEELAKTLARRFPLRFAGAEVFGEPDAHDRRYRS